MEKLTAFEHYIKSVIEAYGTQPGKPLDLSDDTVKRISSKLLALAKPELEPEFQRDEKEYLKMIKNLGKSMIIVTDKLLEHIKEEEKNSESYQRMILARSLIKQLEEIHDSFIKEINSF